MSKVLYGGWVFPAGEAHLPGWMKKVNDKRDGRLLYQGSKYRAALAFCPPDRRRRAVDIGGHIGLWSWMMAKDFKSVVAFEPMPEHRECFKINVFGTHPTPGDLRPDEMTAWGLRASAATNVLLHPVALGAPGMPSKAFIRTRTVGSSGDTGIDLTGKGIEVPLHTLDEFELSDVDFLKCDCEGFEVFVMQGAAETLKRNKPVVIVEQKPETGMEKNYHVGTTDAVKFLQSIGYVQRGVMAGDYIMTAE